MRTLHERGARRVAVCALLDRSVRRIVPLDVAYRGVEVDDAFIVGYGLHVRDRYRNLPDIHVVDRAAIDDDPAVLDALLHAG